jgi:hypothetical protein
MTTYQDPDFDRRSEVSTPFAWAYTLIVFALGAIAGALVWGWL